MDFFLPFIIAPFPFNISYQSKLLFIGSCFSREIGDRMASQKFTILQNPNGILYNPLSISNLIASYIEKRQYNQDELIQNDGIYHSFQHHSSFSGLEKGVILEKINDSQNNAHQFLQKADILIITFGTAFCYQSKSTGDIVANCHKLPGDKFFKRMLEIAEIEGTYLKLINQLKAFNPGLKILFTVSPVKHVRDGVVENMHSKARLIEAVHTIISKSQNTFYFPSYELVTEVLRDYRFYKADMVHPDTIATDFVYKKFCDSFMDPLSINIQKEVSAVLQMINHRPLFKESTTYQVFKNSLIKKIEQIESNFPFIDFSEEKTLLLKP